jgi:hypothetical protein
MFLDKHPKRRGECVELQFMARAAAHGFVVSKPWGDSCRYDFIVEKSSKLVRVQVKATNFRHGTGYQCICLRRTTKGGVPYKLDEIDFLAAYIIPEDVWYIIPFREIAEIKAAIVLAPNRPKNRFVGYMEAWHLLVETDVARGDVAQHTKCERERG